MSSKSAVSGLAATLSISHPAKTDRAILAAMIVVLGKSSTSLPDLVSDEHMDRLLALHENMSTMANKILELKNELVMIKTSAKGWYTTVMQQRSRIMGGFNPWYLEARKLIKETGETNRGAIELGTVHYLLHLKQKWKKTWRDMEEIEEALMFKSSPKNEREYKMLLADLDSMKAFEAKMKKYRDLSFSLSVEYTKFVKADKARFD
ncbi:hypothetical protein V8F33_008480 [Rhypophila sp. PSN 637]